MTATSSRLLRLLVLLPQRPTWTGPELAERLSVEPRTVRRDIGRLRELGYPVESVPGRTGGYRLGRGGSLPPLLLDDGEAVAVAVALRSAASGSVIGIEDASLAALAKLEQVLPSRLRHRVRTLHDSTVSLVRRGDEVEAEHLLVMADACRRGVDLRFPYHSPYGARDGELTHRHVQPYRLVHTGRRWYLVARDVDRDDWRTFRVDRIATEPQLGARFVLADPPDVRRLVSTSISVSPYPEQLRVRIDAPADEVARRVPPSQGHLEPDGDEACVLEVGAMSLDFAIGHLFGMGIPFEVLDPPAAREMVRERAATALSRHGG